MRAHELQESLINAVTYTGLNGFYHLLAGTGLDSTNTVELVKNGNDVEVPGLGIFTFVETIEGNFDTYEKSWDNYLVFMFEDNYYRVEGYLDSHQGGLWSGPLYQVNPVEKTITIWEQA